jgi:uncharacterized protein (TIGR00269 family)
MLKTAERLAVAVSGGKDSISLIDVLSRIEKHFPNVEMIAITVNEGISGYREEGIKIAADYARQLNIEHKVISFKSFYGYTLDEIAQRARELGNYSICAYCGILRRKVLNVMARETSATKLATAHNLDDEAQSILMSLLRGDINELRQESNLSKVFVPRVKPFITTLEKEIALYAFLNGLPFQSAPCPYAGTSMRNEIRRFLNVMEEEHPGMKFTLRSTFSKLQSLLKVREYSIGQCEICGEPSSKKVCRACQILRSLDLI